MVKILNEYFIFSNFELALLNKIATNKYGYKDLSEKEQIVLQYQDQDDKLSRLLVDIHADPLELNQTGFAVIEDYAKAEKRETEVINISKEANNIASKSNKLAVVAICISALTLIVSIVAIIFSILQ